MSEVDLRMVGHKFDNLPAGLTFEYTEFTDRGSKVWHIVTMKFVGLEIKSCRMEMGTYKELQDVVDHAKMTLLYWLSQEIAKIDG